jgi:ParB-like chromosome segregation protein Spo0J
MTETHHNINPDLEQLAYPVDKLRTLPGNPRRGNIPAVAKSYTEFGQQKPIVARRDEEDPEIGIVLAGNTQFQAARDHLNWTHIAVSWVDDWDDKKAAAFALADNRTHDLGEYDDQNLLDMLMEVSDSTDLFDASGYDEDFFADLTEASLEPTVLDDDDEIDEPGGVEAPVGEPPSVDRPAPRPVVQYQIIFDNEEQQQTWYSFVRWLKMNVSGDSIGERLALYIEEYVDAEG